MELYLIWNSYNNSARFQQHQLGNVCNYKRLFSMFVYINVHRTWFCYAGACQATELYLGVEVSAVGHLESCSAA